MHASTVLCSKTLPLPLFPITLSSKTQVNLLESLHQVKNKVE